MGFYSEMNMGEWPPKLDSIQPGLGEAVGATVEETWAESPVSSVLNMQGMNIAKKGLTAAEPEIANAATWLTAFESMGLANGQADFWNPRMEQKPAPISMEDQQTRIRDAGLDGHVKAELDYTDEALSIVMNSKRQELQRNEILATSPMSYTPAMLAAGLATSLADPINVASAFFPVVGEARAMKMLASAGGIGSRAGVRAGIGAVEGAVGAAVLEPLVYAGQRTIQVDYGMTDSLANVGFGAVMGAALQPAAGAAGDWLRGRRGERAAWEMAKPNGASESLRVDFSRQVSDAYQATSTTPELARQYGDASAALFDARARAYAYDTGSSVAEYYERYTPEFRAREGAKGGLNQPLNAGVDLESPVRVVETTPRFEGQNPKVLRKRFPKEVRKSVMDAFRTDGGVLNEDTEMRVGMSGKDFEEHMKFDDSDSIGGLAQLEAVAALPDLMRGAKLVESYKDSKGNPNIKIMHRFQSALRIGDKDYSVKMTVKEFKDGTLQVAEENPIKLYHHRLEKEMPAGNSDTLQSPDVNRPSAGIHKYTLRQLLEDVKDSEGAAFFQQATSTGKKATARASIVFDADGKAVIEFFSTADASTAPHELYHVFRREMAETAADPRASERVRRDWATIEDFVGAKPGQAWKRKMEEKFASAGERFLLEGKAPAPELHTVFERLRQWFMEIYANADAAGLRISPAMRDVFGNMLSTPFDQGDTALRQAMGKMASYPIEQDFTSAEMRMQAQELANAVESPEDLALTADMELRETMQRASASDPASMAVIVDEYAPAIAEATAAAEKAAQKRPVWQTIVECEVNI